jgi:phosphopantetheinyl transferase
MSPDQRWVGIDAAGPDEFTGGYPFHRAFHAAELAEAILVAEEDIPDAAALVWSVKEAAVKALGCGFWRLDPLDIRVTPGAGDLRNTALVKLQGRSLERYPIMEEKATTVLTIREHGAWVSLALVDPCSRLSGT